MFYTVEVDGKVFCTGATKAEVYAMYYGLKDLDNKVHAFCITPEVR
jgi:hypothetical protein